MYTEQISWILFLKFINDLEINKADEAELDGKKYTYIIDEKYRWDVWACPKDAKGKIDLINAKSGDDLWDFGIGELCPYFTGFKFITADVFNGCSPGVATKSLTGTDKLNHSS